MPTWLCPRLIDPMCNDHCQFRLNYKPDGGKYGQHAVQFRAELFNIFNKTTVSDISQTVPNLLPGDVAFTSLTEFLKTNSAFGQVFATRRAREVQLGLKFSF